MSLSRFFFAPTFVNAWATAKPPLPTRLVAEARRQRGCEWVRSGKTERRALTDAHSIDRMAAHQPWLKLGALVLVVAALGLPINYLFRYALLVVAAVLVVAGT